MSIGWMLGVTAALSLPSATATEPWGWLPFGRGSEGEANSSGFAAWLPTWVGIPSVLGEDIQPDRTYVWSGWPTFSETETARDFYTRW